MANFPLGQNFQIELSIFSKLQKEIVGGIPMPCYLMITVFPSLLICKYPVQTRILVHIEKNNFLPLLISYLKVSTDPDWSWGYLL